MKSKKKINGKKPSCSQNCWNSGHRFDTFVKDHFKPHNQALSIMDVSTWCLSFSFTKVLLYQPSWHIILADSLVSFGMVKHGATAESNYQWWTHSVQSGTLEHSGEQLAVEKMEKARWRAQLTAHGNIWDKPGNGDFTRVIHQISGILQQVAGMLMLLYGAMVWFGQNPSNNRIHWIQY